MEKNWVGKVDVQGPGNASARNFPWYDIVSVFTENRIQLSDGDYTVANWSAYTQGIKIHVTRLMLYM